MLGFKTLAAVAVKAFFGAASRADVFNLSRGFDASRFDVDVQSRYPFVFE